MPRCPLKLICSDKIRTLTGVAPVTKRSGKSCTVVQRQACHDRLANAMYHWARARFSKTPEAARKCRLQSRGHSHGRALRSIADHLSLNVTSAMLKTGTTSTPFSRRKKALDKWWEVPVACRKSNPNIQMA